MSSPAHGSLAERIDALLPQTQCRRCGYSGCRPYAEAVASGAAPINRCPPGGDATIVELAALLGAPVEPLDPTCGAVIEFTVARIDESLCIGCTLCIDACPVDAIVGAAKQMHTVLARHCTGCALCIGPCPVDCIALLPPARAWTRDDARHARERYVARNERLVRGTSTTTMAPDANPERAKRKAAVALAIARARARRTEAGRARG
ncbi:MAG: RnfABCDGE type electron transport complex subunit B [Betaproteobacteria bacterium]|nr:MAG: RnfABCDGE type electron transport complex subunit B [Betaproteobacteria bacterium]